MERTTARGPVSFTSCSNRHRPQRSGAREASKLPREVPERLTTRPQRTLKRPLTQTQRPGEVAGWAEGQ